jgi:hypothetical protein
MPSDAQPRTPRATATRRELLILAGAAAASLGVSRGPAAESGPAAKPADDKPRARISIRVGVGLWLNPKRKDELLAFVREYRDTIDEVAFFTGFTHPPLPLAEIEARAVALGRILPEFRALGVATGINHLATMGHLDENLENSLREPWQHLVDFDGSVSASCYCAADPRMQRYLRDAYVALARAKPDFLWVDDDVRLESHGPIRFACFCERCMATFSKETGKAWTRESLVAALRSGPRPERLALRRRWLAHNRAYLGDLLARVRDAVDSVGPTIPLGFMTGEAAYSGFGFDAWTSAMSGPRKLPVKWRPGGGFYTDESPAQLLDKAHSTGRQIAMLPSSVVDIQYEHENFPYQRLKKSVTTFTTECAAAIAAGCTGAALNCLGIADDPVEEFRAYFDGVRGRRAFYDRLVAAFGRSPCEGVWSAFTPDHFAALQPDGDWFTAPAWGGDLRYFNELAEIGIPPGYRRDGARVTALGGDGCLDFSKEELLKLLSGGVLLDIASVFRLYELGLGEHTGFSVRDHKDRDTLEQFTSDPLNGRFAGWHRDCRPSFYPEAAWRIEPASPQARPLSEIVDFAPKSHGVTSGVFENRLGGRVAVFGYYPWRSVQSLAKASQLKAVCRWLSRDTLPGYVASYVKAALWCRRDSAGRPALLLLNASSDPLPSVLLHVRDADRLRLTRVAGPAEVLQKTGTDGPYALFAVPNVAPWEAILLTQVSEGIDVQAVAGLGRRDELRRGFARRGVADEQPSLSSQDRVLGTIGRDFA